MVLTGHFSFLMVLELVIRLFRGARLEALSAVPLVILMLMGVLCWLLTSPMSVPALQYKKAVFIKIFQKSPFFLFYFLIIFETLVTISKGQINLKLNWPT